MKIGLFTKTSDGKHPTNINKKIMKLMQVMNFAD